MPVSVDIEAWTLDGFDLNDPANGWTMTAAQVEPAKKRPSWIGGPDVDGQALLEPAFSDNAVFTFRLEMNPQASMNAALAKLATVLDLLQECENTPGGLALVNSPAGSTLPVTYRALLGEVTGLPREASGADAGWLLSAPVVTVQITCLPFGELPALANVTDDFSTNTITSGQWTEDSGTATIGSGVLSWASASGAKKLRRTGMLYRLADVQLTAKVTTGASVTGLDVGVTHTENGGDYLMASLTAANLVISKVVSGSATTLNSVAHATAVSTSKWLRTRIEGDVVTAEVFTTAPTATSTAAATVSYTLTAGDKTKFGAGVAGQVGIRAANIAATGLTVDDWMVQPNVFVGMASALSGTIYGVPGDAPAAGSLLVSDAQGVGRDYVQWGAEQRSFVAGSPVQIDASSFVTSGYQGTYAAGPPDGVSANVGPTASVVFATAQLTNNGSFRVFARASASTVTTDPRIRLTWQTGSSTWGPNAWQYVTTKNGTYCDVDLGVVTIPTGSTWRGRVESIGVLDDATVTINKLSLIPVDFGYGIASATSAPSMLSVSARDFFDQGTLSGSLNGLALPYGGSWATTGGSTPDFTKGSSVVKRTVSTAGRLVAVAGTTSLVETLVDASINDAPVPASGQGFVGVMARYVDANNWLSYGATRINGSLFMQVRKCVAGTQTVLATFTNFTDYAQAVTKRLQMTVDGDGEFRAYEVVGSAPTLRFAGSDPALATGGVLASGRAGFISALLSGTGPFTHTIDSFTAGSYQPTRTVFVGRRALITASGVSRLSSDGASEGQPDSYRGTYFTVPPAGRKNLPTRVVARTRRYSPSVLDDGVTDKTMMQVLYTPRVRAAPR